MSRPSPLQHLYLSAMHQEPARERLKRRIDPLEVLDDLRSHGNLAQVGDSVRGHGLSKDFAYLILRRGLCDVMLLPTRQTERIR